MVNIPAMVLVLLMTALLVIGIAKGAEAARAGRIAGRTVLWIVILCTASAIFGAMRYTNAVFAEDEASLPEGWAQGRDAVDFFDVKADVEAVVTCPYCGEPISVLVDCSLEQQTYVEDCQVCCQPMVIHAVVDEDDPVARRPERKYQDRRAAKRMKAWQASRERAYSPTQ